MILTDRNSILVQKVSNGYIVHWTARRNATATTEPAYLSAVCRTAEELPALIEAAANTLSARPNGVTLDRQPHPTPRSPANQQPEKPT